MFGQLERFFEDFSGINQNIDPLPAVREVDLFQCRSIVTAEYSLIHIQYFTAATNSDFLDGNVGNFLSTLESGTR